MQFEPIDPGAADPPFEQLRRQIATRISRGELTAGTRLPTVRDLAAQLGRLLADPALRERLGRAGRARALEQHGHRQANDRFFAFLGDAAQKGGAQ